MSRSLRSVLVVGAALALIFSGTASAQADDRARCKAFNACLFTHLSYDNLGRQMEFNVREIAWPQNDQATSIATKASECNSRFYEHKEFGGRSIDFGQPGHPNAIVSDPDLRNGGGGGNYTTENWNDRISSVKFITCS